MSTKGLIISGGVIVLTVLFVVAYSLFNALGVTQSRVVRNEITIVTGSDIKLYDGTPLTNEEWYMESGSLAEGDTLVTNMNTSITTPGTIDNDIGITILNSAGDNVTVNYNVIYKLGTLSILPIELTFATSSFTRTYDGTPLSLDEWQLQSGSLLDGHTIQASMNSSITNPGSVENEVDINIINSSGTNMNHIYGITYQNGTLTVEPIDLLIRSYDDSKVYDGTPLSNSGWELVNGNVIDDHSLNVTVNGEITNVGTTENDLFASVTDQQGNNVSSIYNIVLEPGTLEIEAKDIVIETESTSKIYDGTPLTSDGWSLVFGQLSNNHRIEYEMPASITLPGEEDNRIYVQILDQFDNDVTDEYNIEYVFGTLTVSAIPITISTADDNKGYDGTPLSGGTGTLTSGSLVDAHTIEYGAEQTITIPGSILNEIDITIYDGVGNDVTSAYSINEDFGTLTIDAITLIISSSDANKTYDGTPLSDDSWELLGGTLLAGHTLVVEVDNEITMPGIEDNTIVAYVINAQSNDVSDYYDFQLLEGELTVYKRDITISTGTFSQDYDGSQLLGGEGSLVSGTLLAGHVIDYTSESSITLPGVIENEVEIVIYDGSGIDVTAAYDINDQFGTLTVNPIPIILSSDSESKPFDTTPLSNDTWSIVSGAVLGGHILVVDLDTEITYPGSVDNTIDVSVINGSGSDVSAIYDFTLQEGTLTIEPINITISTLEQSQAYDGTPLLGGSGSITAGSLLAGHTIQYGSENSITLPGSITNAIDYTILDGLGNDVTDGYNVTEDFGILTIEPITLILKSPDANKIYDGTPLFDKTYEILGGSLLGGHSLIVDVDNEITNPGTIDNTIVAFVLDASDNDVTDIYDIEYITGELTVFAHEITITTLTDAKDYDGVALDGGTGTITFGTLMPGHYITYGPEQSITTPGSINNDITYRIFNADDVDVTIAYDVTENFGTLTIHAIPLTLESSSDTKLYDGIPLSNDIWTFNDGTLLPGHTLNVELNESITDPGSVDNTMTITITDDATGASVIDVYDITEITGTLTVSGYPLTVETNTDSKSYDGTPLVGVAPTITAGGLVLDHYIEYGPVNSITLPGSLSNDVSITIYDGNDNDVTFMYDITEDFGTLTIQGITIVIKSPDDSKIYDGTPLSNNTWELISGDVIAGHTLYVDVDNEITDVGQVDNTMFAYVLDGDGNDVTGYYNIIENTGTLTILSSAFSSSEIATNSFEIPEEDVLSVYSDSSGILYFRDRSLGDYTGTGWTSGEDHDAAITSNPLEYPGTALVEDGYTPYQIQIEYLRAQVPYLSPYYTTDPLGGTSDIKTSGDTSVIDTINIVSYNYNPADAITIQDVPLSADELLYRAYVYANYLDVPASTLAEMQALATANGLSAASPTIIADVQNYIRNAASYNLNFAPIPEGEDVAVYFLTVSQEGICQHYATAATLMYRSLGIPARYTTGYVGSVVMNQWTNITSLSSHAWVEVYIDGFGWVPVEVTGSEVEPIEITVLPETVREEYEEGKTITASSLLIFGYPDFAADGYTYSATYGGSLSSIGSAASTVTSITIYDSEGHDVTYRFDITILDGLLQMYGYEIELTTGSSTDTYDGEALTNSVSNIIGSLAANHEVDYITFTGEQTTVGSSKNSAIIRIIDEFNNDVTNLYKITYTFGDLVVTPNLITITSDSGTKSFDGTALTVDTYQITSGSLASTDTIDVVITGTQTNIGSSQNTISSVTITNNGTDVTSNYIITIEEGELIVTPF